MEKRPLIQCQGVNKNFDKTQAVKQFNLDIQEEEILAILGPSGCGKTTALRILAGFEMIDGGKIIWKDQVFSSPDVLVPPEDRPIGIVFQDFALFPHLSVEQNIAFGLKGSEKEKKIRIQELLSLIDLELEIKKMPHMLSGGQQQRVALARALAPRPDLILLDEPFSNLDRQLSIQLRFELREVLKKEKLSAVLVTHDQYEAFTFADQIVMMNQGHILQKDSGEKIYHKPANSWVASFMGGINLIEAEIREGVIHSVLGTYPNENNDLKGNCQLMVRAEDFSIQKAEKEQSTGIIRRVVFLGNRIILRVLLNNDQEIKVQVGSREKWEEGQNIQLKANYFISVQG